MQEILRIFPNSLSVLLQKVIGQRWNKLQEIRIRIHQPIELIFNAKTEWIFEYVLKQTDSAYIIGQLSEHSLYRLEDELREGFITIKGGHRIGLAGKVITRNGEVKALQHITFLNIRIAKEKIGVAKDWIPYLHQDKKYLNSLIIGTPQSGKTTMIRDITRFIANGVSALPATKVAVIDERSEIAASVDGIPQNQLGLRTDVMDACPKAAGMMMAIRSMSPQVIVVDEIGSEADVQALMEAINAGVTIFCTIHGRTLLELKKRPSLHYLFEQKMFERYLILSDQQQPGVVKTIMDQEERTLYQISGGNNHEMARRSHTY